FYPLTFLLSLFFILNYRVWENYVFYLSLYIPLTVAVGTGIGFILDRVHHSLQHVPKRSYQWLHLPVSMFFVAIVLQTTGLTRWQAIRNGSPDFVTADYPFPAENLNKPRLVAQTRLAGMEDNAVFVLDFQTLYSTAYLAHVEKGLTNMLFFEAMPYGNDGEIAPT